MGRGTGRHGQEGARTGRDDARAHAVGQRRATFRATRPLPVRRESERSSGDDDEGAPRRTEWRPDLEQRPRSRGSRKQLSRRALDMDSCPKCFRCQHHRRDRAAAYRDRPRRPRARRVRTMATGRADRRCPDACFWGCRWVSTRAEARNDRAMPAGRPLRRPLAVSCANPGSCGDRSEGGPREPPTASTRSRERRRSVSRRRSAQDRHSPRRRRQRAGP